MSSEFPFVPALPQPGHQATAPFVAPPQTPQVTNLDEAKRAAVASAGVIVDTAGRPLEQATAALDTVADLQPAAAVATAADLQKDVLRDVMASGSQAAEGLDAVAVELAQFFRSSAEANAAAFRKLTQVRSPAEWLAVQQDYFGHSLDAFVAHSQRIAETWVGATRRAMQPVQDRMAELANRMPQPEAR